MVLAENVISSGRNDLVEALESVWRLATWGACQAVWIQVPPNDARGVLGSFGCRVGSRGGFLHRFGWRSWGDALLGAQLRV